MKDQPLEALMADPAFDPTIWMLQAFKSYMEDNPETVLMDETSRPYLLEALETENDWNKVIRRLPPDRTVINDVVRSMNRIVLDSNVATLSRMHRSLRDRIVKFEKDSHESWGDILLQVPGLDAKPALSTLQRMKSDEIVKGIKTWETKDWAVGFWDDVIGLLEDRWLIDLLRSKKFPRAVCSERKISWGNESKVKEYSKRIVRFQDMLVKILARLPDYGLVDFGEAVSYLTSDDLEKLYTKRKNRKETAFVEDPRIWRRISTEEWGEPELTKTPPDLLNGLMCRCGYMCNSSSGLSLHQKGCEYGKFLPFAKVLEIHLAKRGEGPPLMCRSCGKVCKSKPGYTLHRKKCSEYFSSDVLYKQCIQRI